MPVDFRHLGFVALTLTLLWTSSATADGVIDGKTAAAEGDFMTAVAIWRPLAEAADPRAETYLGQMYENGYGVPQDYERAVYWFRRAAERGYASGQYHLGFMYHHGRGLQRSQTEALKWYRAAAEQGDLAAQYNLGRMYAHGLVVERDLVEAHMWFDLASRERTSVRPLATRDLRTVAREMSDSEIEEAVKRAENWRPS
jgi:TPR repeat protein